MKLGTFNKITLASLLSKFGFSNDMYVCIENFDFIQIDLTINVYIRSNTTSTSLQKLKDRQRKATKRAQVEYYQDEQEKHCAKRQKTRIEKDI